MKTMQAKMPAIKRLVCEQYQQYYDKNHKKRNGFGNRNKIKIIKQWQSHEKGNQLHPFQYFSYHTWHTM